MSKCVPHPPLITSNMFRFARLLLLLAITATSFSGALTPNFSPLSAPRVEAACSIWIFNCDNPTQVPYCSSNDPTSSNYCSTDRGVEIVKNNVNLGIKDRKFSDYVQDVIVYLL